MRMTLEIEQWLSPLLNALLANKQAGEAFAQFMESAIERSTAATPPTRAMDEVQNPSTLTGRIGDVPSGPIGGVDWIRLGQLIREELAWDDYPATPPTIS